MFEGLCGEMLCYVWTMCMSYRVTPVYAMRSSESSNRPPGRRAPASGYSLETAYQTQQFEWPHSVPFARRRRAAVAASAGSRATVSEVNRARVARAEARNVLSIVTDMQHHKNRALHV